MITVTDTKSVSRSASMTIRLTDMNEAPILVGNIEKQTLSPGQNFSLIVSSGLFSDVDASDQLSYTATVAMDFRFQVGLPSPPAREPSLVLHPLPT